ncbi:hypothetical protein HETIRDRAFT_457468 [Heterobasidion irregulare TC 32-1]|uniref:Uncharacterized protein n=1 Tax=Heterobasidion irregulare (strain TC 32-1) TaxID=747525 RepID=W4KKX8_HETIT|nr:uncharacterized protein HETIRDRAFT_457468 [Heterobasidion irregulare TC 32-1]ETW85721.1 hypothetical protein HETIRDRAFT_457468 [Heterobasidion irregulare TC 32-1]
MYGCQERRSSSAPSAMIGGTSWTLLVFLSRLLGASYRCKRCDAAREYPHRGAYTRPSCRAALMWDACSRLERPCGTAGSSFPGLPKSFQSRALPSPQSRLRTRASMALINPTSPIRQASRPFSFWPRPGPVLESLALTREAHQHLFPSHRLARPRVLQVPGSISHPRYRLALQPSTPVRTTAASARARTAKDEPCPTGKSTWILPARQSRLFSLVGSVYFIPWNPSRMHK